MPDAGSIFAMMRRLRHMDDNDYLHNLVAYQAAPTIEMIKPATLVCPSGRGRNYREAWKRGQRSLVRTLGFPVACLKEADDGIMLLAYRPHLMRQALQNDEAVSILAENGYDTANFNLAAIVRQLEKKCLPRTIPHEIGLFLGYPPRDVRCFMRFGGKNSILTGCWKAYGDVESARHYFERCSVSKRTAAELIGAGRPFGEVAAYLRRSSELAKSA